MKTTFGDFSPWKLNLGCSLVTEDSQMENNINWRNYTMLIKVNVIQVKCE